MNSQSFAHQQLYDFTFLRFQNLATLQLYDFTTLQFHVFRNIS